MFLWNKKNCNESPKLKVKKSTRFIWIPSPEDRTPPQLLVAGTFKDRSSKAEIALARVSEWDTTDSVLRHSQQLRVEEVKRWKQRVKWRLRQACAPVHARKKYNYKIKLSIKATFSRFISLLCSNKITSYN